MVSVMICIFNSKQLIHGAFEDCIDLFNSHHRSFLCQNLYQVIPLLLWKLFKSIWAPFHHKLAQHNFLEFIFNFDARCVSPKFTTYSCFHLCRKCLLMRFVLSVVLERTVRFLIKADVVLELHHNCLPSNKWLDFKYVLIVSG